MDQLEVPLSDPDGAQYFDGFRPRSKSDSRGHKPNFIFALRSVHIPWTSERRSGHPGM